MGTRQVPLSRGSSRLLTLVAAVLILGELAAHAAQRFSSFYRGVRKEQQAAQSMRHGVLLIGNSLLKHGIDTTQLNRNLSRFAIEGTAFYDWYYGLASLFRSGMRPDSVVLCLNAAFLTSDELPDELSANLLLDASAIHDLHLDPTASAGLYTGHLSALYGAGAELRGGLLRKLLGSSELWDRLLPLSVSTEAPVDTTKVAARLRAMRDLSVHAHVRFLFLLAPATQAESDAVEAAGKMASVPVLDPLPRTAFSPDEYEPDGYHLNPKGAAKWTSAVARSLQ